MSTFTAASVQMSYKERYHTTHHFTIECIFNLLNNYLEDPNYKLACEKRHAINVLNDTVHKSYPF